MKKESGSGNGVVVERSDNKIRAGKSNAAARLCALKPFLNISELAAALGEKERSIRTWTRSGILPVCVIGTRTHRYSLSAVLAALEKRSV